MKNTTAILALMGAMILGGCSDEGKTDVPVAPPNRMQNPEYLAKLEVLEKEQQSALRVCANARSALAAAKEEGASAERIAELEAAVAAADKILDDYYDKAQKTVRDQIWSDLKAEQKQSKQQKGK